MSTPDTPSPRRRRGIFARFSERTAQLAYIGIWAGMFIVAGFISAGATWVPFVGKPGSDAPPITPSPGSPPVPLTEDGLKMPAKVVGTQIQPVVDGKPRPKFWAGVNLGSSVPGQEPGATAATRLDFDRWLPEMAEMGVSVVRIYTILSPAFYDALRDYNLAHPDRPLYVLQGVWIPEDRFYETDDAWHPDVVDEMRKEIRDVVGAVHGDAVIDKIPGHAGGIYNSDISPWLMGWSFGIEWDPEASHATDVKNKGRAPHRGRYFGSKPGSTPMETWIASNLDYIAELQAARGWSVPMTFTNWDTTDPLRHPYEPLFDQDLVQIDATHVYATRAWPAGYFASFHAYPYYPDFQRWTPRYQTYERTLDGRADPYAAYLNDLRAHHPGMPVVITEFGQPTSLGCAHLAPLGRDQGCHSEREAMANIVDMLNVQHSEGLAGGIVFTWLDEWFKFTWNTIDYELPGTRRAVWRSVLTNEEHFGLIAAEPGQSPVVDLDGTDEEWPEEQKPIGTGKRSVKEVAARHDAENVYLRVKVAPEVWKHKRIVIGLNARPGGNRGLPGTSGVDADAEMAVVIAPGATPTARMYHAAWIEALGVRFGGHSNPRENYFPADAADILPGSGKWVPLRQILNYPYPVRALGIQNPVEWRDASLMPWGPADPAEEGFDDRNLLVGRGDVLEIALPWSMMSFADPSKHSLYVVTPNPDVDKTVTTRTTDRLGISFAVDGEPLVRTKGFTWEGWDDIQWHERRKDGWQLIQKAFESFRGPTPPVVR